MTKPKTNALPADVASDLDRLLSESVPPRLEPNDITLKRVMDQGISANVAKRLIKQWVQDKKVVPLGKRRTRNGIFVDAWRAA